MMGEAEKQKAIRALFPSIAGVLEGDDWHSPAGSESGGDGRDPQVLRWDEWG